MIPAYKLLALEDYVALPLGALPAKGRMVKASHLVYLRELIEVIHAEHRNADDLERRAEDAESEAEKLDKKCDDLQDEQGILENRIEELEDVLRDILCDTQDRGLQAKLLEVVAAPWRTRSYCTRKAK